MHGSNFGLGRGRSPKCEQPNRQTVDSNLVAFVTTAARADDLIGGDKDAVLPG